MKTLRGKPIIDDLAKLYNYYFAIDGGEEEALQLAEANGLYRELIHLVESQLFFANKIASELSFATRHCNLCPIIDGLPCAYSEVQSANDVIALHAKTGEYKFVVNFYMLFTNETPQRFCSNVDFHHLAINGMANQLLIQETPLHLINNSFEQVCQRAARWLRNGLIAALRKFDDYMLPFNDLLLMAEGINVIHNLPNYPIINFNTKLF